MKSRLRVWIRGLPWVPRLLRLARAGRRHLVAPRLSGVDLGDLNRLSPLCRNWGYDRGTPIDRYYIEQFLSQHRDAVHGVVLEIGDDQYTRSVGGNRVRDSQVLHVAQAHAGVTIVGDLTRLDHVPPGQFDCAIVVQTLQFIPDVLAAIRGIHRLLRPGGVALVTVPVISRIDRDPGGQWATEWAFTSRSANRLFADVFGGDAVTTSVYGNVLVATAFLHGLAAEELAAEQLTHLDPDFEVLVGVRAIRAG